MIEMSLCRRTKLKRFATVLKPNHTVVSSCRKYCKGNLVKADLCIKVREGERKNDMCMTEKAHNDDGLCR